MIIEPSPSPVLSTTFFSGTFSRLTCRAILLLLLLRTLASFAHFARDNSSPKSFFLAPSTLSSQRPPAFPIISFFWRLGVLCARTFLVQWQRERELTAFARFTLHPNSSSMQLNKLLGQRQAKSGPLDLV